MDFNFTYLMTDIFEIVDLNIMLLSTPEFLENWCNENHNFLRVEMKFGHVFYVFTRYG